MVRENTNHGCGKQELYKAPVCYSFPPVNLHDKSQLFCCFISLFLCMRYYFLSIKDNAIDKIQSKGLGNASQYIHYEKFTGFEEIYYKTEDGKITIVMCEATNLLAAKSAINEFLFCWSNP
jgi:hypothetical protein